MVVRGCWAVVVAFIVAFIVVVFIFIFICVIVIVIVFVSIVIGLANAFIVIVVAGDFGGIPAFVVCGRSGHGRNGDEGR